MSALAHPYPIGRSERVHLTQGEWRVSGSPDIVLCTLLGSCVAACIRDPIAGVGGLNHFLLPGDGGGSQAIRYGVNAMEILINGLLKLGARRENLEAKLFGGARMMDRVSDVGRQNAEFAVRYLRDENIIYAGGSLGGVHARKVEFWPATGRIRQFIVRSPVVEPAPVVLAGAPVDASDGAVELF